MQKKTLRRIAITAVAAPALAFGAPALASADAYYEAESSGANSNGAFHYELEAFAGDGKSWFEESFSVAGEGGAYSSETESGAG
ncbi:hypothetical protein KGD83_11285 [Nocardiopsis akebiae]|uniref:Uncharacterized protein n=1 Tax=Nocardiopsis akebiae TaxID=2831968 RepID=A0ABX8CDC8_9ACTN|nr:hypothetical protein [Nocardiopsis akebiae]QUX31018.1 hypothetical protein KGD83_11285 [Nocardiopsis akebiae]